MLLVAVLLTLMLALPVRAGNFKELFENARLLINIAYIEEPPENAELEDYILNYPALLIHIQEESGEDFVIVNNYIGVSCPECQEAMMELVTDIYDYLRQLKSCRPEDKRIDALMKDIRSTFGYDTERFRRVLKRAMSLILSKEFSRCSIERDKYKEMNINRILLAYSLARAFGYDTGSASLSFSAGIISYPNRDALDITSYFSIPYEMPNVVRELKAKCGLKRPTESDIRSAYSAAGSRAVNLITAELISEALAKRCKDVLRLLIK